MADKNGSALSTIVMMTTPEAEKARDNINQESGAYYARQRANVLDFYNREGWRALGYKDWTDCAEREFGFTRRRVYQLMDEATIESELKTALGDKAPELTGRGLRSLKDVPADQRPAVAQAAADSTPGSIPGAGAVRTAWKKSGAKKAKPKKEKELTIGEQAQDNEKLHRALMVIGDTCTRNFRKAIEDGTIELSKAEVLELSELEDDRMQEAEKLISVNRWTLRRALKFLDKMPEVSDPIETLVNLAIASLDDEWKGDFGAVTIVATVHRRKLKAD